MTELWWVVEAPDGQLLPWTFEPAGKDVERRHEEWAAVYPLMNSEGHRVVQVEVTRV